MSKAMRLLALLLLLLGTLVFAACSDSSGETDSAETPTDTPAESTDTEGERSVGEVNTASENVWEAVQEKGTLVVGTAADYPPFAYYNDEFKLVGFDVELARLIGEQMGVDVEFNDMSFYGLEDALHVGQIDLAIAAMTVTDARGESIDFSHAYFISSGALVAKTGAGIDAISAPEQIAPFRLGVETGSVYQEWAQEELVDTGILPQENLFVYPALNTAGKDLQEDRIDLVAFDLVPAELAIQEYDDLAIVGSGSDQQHYAVAAQKGQADIVAQVNAALEEIKTSGQWAELVDTYIGPVENFPEIPLEPVLVSNDGTVVANTNRGGGNEFVCRDGMEYVADLNLDDNNMENPPTMQPGQQFQKGWRVRNVGTCTWDSSYFLNFVSGNIPGAQMNGGITPIQGQVAPGQTYDFWVNLVAPTAPGVYQAFWALFDGQNEAFGARLWLGIQVGQQPTPTPLPTQTPVPGIQFWTDNGSINQGQCTTNHWRTENIKAVYYYQQGQNWQNHGVTGSGDRQECPQTTTVYELRVVNQNDSVEIRQLQINVTPTTNAPTINSFNVAPQRVEVGNCVRVDWNVSGTVSTVKVSRSGTVLWDNAPLVANYDDCSVTQDGSYEYVVEATGPGGTSRQVKNVDYIRPTPIIGTSWRLTNYRTDNGLVAVIPGTTVTASFESNFKVDGSGGCNSYNASYSASANNIRISSLSSTNQTCNSPAGIMQQESEVFLRMQLALLYRIEGNILYITDGQNNTLLQYTQQ